MSDAAVQKKFPPAGIDSPSSYPCPSQKLYPGDGSAERPHVDETFAAGAADNSLTIRVLPRRAWCGWDFFNTHAFDTLGEGVPVDAVATANEITRCSLAREGGDCQ